MTVGRDEPAETSSALCLSSLGARERDAATQGHGRSPRPLDCCVASLVLDDGPRGLDPEAQNELARAS